MRIVKLNETSRRNILADLLKRDPNNYGAYADTVQEIVETVKRDGDQAVFAYTKEFDQAEIKAGNLKVTEQEIEEAMKEVDPELIEILKKNP